VTIIALCIREPLTEYLTNFANTEISAFAFEVTDNIHYVGSNEAIVIKALPNTGDSTVALLRLEVSNAKVVGFTPDSDLIMAGACDNGDTYTDNSLCVDLATTNTFSYGQELGTMQVQWLNNGDSTISVTAENGYYNGQELYTLEIEPLTVAIIGELPLTGSALTKITCPQLISSTLTNNHCASSHGYPMYSGIDCADYYYEDTQYDWDNIAIDCNTSFSAYVCNRCYNCKDNGDDTVECGTLPTENPNCPLSLCDDGLDGTKCNASKTYSATCKSGVVTLCSKCNSCSQFSNDVDYPTATAVTCVGDTPTPSEPTPSEPTPSEPTPSIPNPVNWDCDDSSYNGQQYWTCSNGNLYKCESNVAKETDCGGQGCTVNTPGTDDVCGTTTPTDTVPVTTKVATTTKTATSTPTPTPTSSGKMACGTKKCEYDSDCETGLPDYECDEDTTDWPNNNICVILCDSNQTREGYCSCVDKVGVTCGKIDVDGNGILNYIDLAAFAAVYNKTCTDTAPTAGCGGKDTNKDGKINYVDLQSFTSRYHTVSNDCSK
jgi:hypothetical protein